MRCALAPPARISSPIGSRSSRSLSPEKNISSPVPQKAWSDDPAGQSAYVSYHKAAPETRQSSPKPPHEALKEPRKDLPAHGQCTGHISQNGNSPSFPCRQDTPFCQYQKAAALNHLLYSSVLHPFIYFSLPRVRTQMHQALYL